MVREGKKGGMGGKKGGEKGRKGKRKRGKERRRKGGRDFPNVPFSLGKKSIFKGPLVDVLSGPKTRFESHDHV